jgi:hypothetical protein
MEKKDEIQNNVQGNPTQTIIVTQAANKSNGMGTAGFVLAIIAIVLGWIPVLGWIIWLLGLIFSAIGIFKVPRGLAIAGLVVSLIGIIMLVAVFAAIGTALMLH